MFRKLIKKLNNFRFTAMIAACVSGLAAVYGLLSFFFFHYAGEILPGEEDTYVRAVGFYNHENGGMLSFIVFAGFIVSVICGIIVAYSMVPYIKNKEKLVPSKGVLITGFVGGVFELVLVIMMILLLGDEETPKTSVGIIISLPFGILSTLGQLCYLLPYIKCNFYMPEPKHN